GWQIEMFGGLRVQQADRTISRFPSRKAASLLTFLAFHLHRSHSREELMELLWPDEDPAATRLRFRQVLTTLRHELEPDGAASSPLLLADRASVRLDPRVVTTDVEEFESALRTAQTGAQDARCASLQRAADLYRGELLPGFYEDWVCAERRRLASAWE